jgi:hypothetical protein
MAGNFAFNSLVQECREKIPRIGGTRDAEDKKKQLVGLREAVTTWALVHTIMSLKSMR